MSKNLHCVSKTGRFYTRPTHAHRRALPFLRSNSSLLLPQNMVQLVRAINHPMADCPPPLLPWPLQLSGRLTARDSRRTVTVCAHSHRRQGGGKPHRRRADPPRPLARRSHRVDAGQLRHHGTTDRPTGNRKLEGAHSVVPKPYEEMAALMNEIESRSWIAVLVLAIAMAANSVYLFARFKEDRIVGPVFFVISVATAIVVWRYFRFGVVWAWYAVWIFPISFLVVVVAFLVKRNYSLSAYYAVAAAALGVSILLPMKEFFSNL